MVSFFRAPIRNITPQAQVSILQVYRYITGNYAKLATERLRSIADHNEARKFKAEAFDYVTFSGSFSTRRNGELIEHSGFMCFDIDKIESEEQLQNIKASLVAEERLHTVLLFRSPSGNGLKWVVEVPDRVWLRQSQQPIVNGQQILTPQSQATAPLIQGSNNERTYSPPVLGGVPQSGEGVTDIITQNHKLLYERIRHYLFEKYAIETDHTSDVARPCYLCYDDDAYYDEPTFKANPASEFLVDKSRDARLVRPIANHNPLPIVQHDDIETLVCEIERRRIDITADYANWVRVGFALASVCGVAGEGLFHRISQFHPNYNPRETHKLYNSCLKNNSGVVTIGTIVYLMKN